jgi:hypothetical protein
MMLGIYTSVVTSSAKAATGSPALALDDLMAVRKLNFPPAGSQFTPPHPLPGAFKFKDYAPAVFHSLRERFEVDQTQYLKSLGGAAEYIEFNSNSSACGGAPRRRSVLDALTPPPARPPAHLPDPQRAAPSSSTRTTAST